MNKELSKKKIAEQCDFVGIEARSVLNDLEFYEQELIRWQKIKNLVSRETLTEIWSRHFLDSTQLFTLFPEHSQHLLDFGSGGGLPAIPLAIMAKQKSLKVHMVEANGRKCSFLGQLARQLQLDVEVHNVRAEALELDVSIDIFTARGFAPLDQAFGYIFPHFMPESQCFLQKGRGYSQEIAQSFEKWRYDCLEKESLVAKDSVILNIRNLQKR